MDPVAVILLVISGLLLLGALGHFEFMDPRVLEATIDPPLWWRDQRDLVARVETIIDLSAHPVGDCDDPLAKAGIRVEAVGRIATLLASLSNRAFVH